ncbi:hypothetical protein AVEN_99700-1 [Araneus ventricosus]|uniref:Uncharacterized protein n=1 Tax=Araneus ventricosus TaxID=182803 RepID=A0A4Y2VV72_ARAVE|nr:hypothetical protein AVEN_99700-1 [Araneus ventricosus]
MRLFWDGPRNFELRSGDEGDTRAGTPSPSFRTSPMGGRLVTTYNLTCSRPHTRRIFIGIGFRTLRNRSRYLTTKPLKPSINREHAIDYW